MYQLVAPAGGDGVAVRPPGPRRRVSSRGYLRAATPFAGVLLALSATLVVAAAAGRPGDRDPSRDHGRLATKMTPGHRNSAEHAEGALARLRAEDAEDDDDDLAVASIASVVTPPTGTTAAPPSQSRRATAPAPSRRAAASFQVPRAFNAPGSTSIASPWPSVQLIPPAALPAPATFTPATAGIGIMPLMALAGSALLIGVLAGVRIVRRPG
jgi:hypothetical protein